MNKAQRRDLLRQYKRTFGRGLLAVVAERVGKDASVVSRTFAGKVRAGDDAVMSALAAEVARMGARP
jgi:hypothetical protein